MAVVAMIVIFVGFESFRISHFNNLQQPQKKRRLYCISRQNSFFFF